MLVIASSAIFTPQAQLVIDIAKQRGYAAKHVVLPCTNNFVELKYAFQTLFHELSKTGEQVWLNASNGSRFQSMIAVEASKPYHVPIYLVDPRADEIVWLNDDEKKSITIQDKLNLKEYFQLMGRDVEYTPSEQIDRACVVVARRWIAKVDELGQALGRLNYLAYTANDCSLTSDPLDYSMLADEALLGVIRDLVDKGLAIYKLERVSFTSEEARFFANGGWLEDHIGQLMQELQKTTPMLQDTAKSVFVSQQGVEKPVKNEIDVAALVNNRLHIIECKTKRFKGGSGVNTLYKLDSLNDLLGGIKGRAALISYYPITAAEMRRAAEMGIAIITSDDFAQLRNVIKRWLLDA